MICVETLKRPKCQPQILDKSEARSLPKLAEHDLKEPKQYTLKGSDNLSWKPNTAVLILELYDKSTKTEKWEEQHEFSKRMAGGRKRYDWNHGEKKAYNNHHEIWYVLHHKKKTGPFNLGRRKYYIPTFFSHKTYPYFHKNKHRARVQAQKLEIPLYEWPKQVIRRP